MYFETDLVGYEHKNLSDLDWDVLEGLEEVLSVS